MISADDLAVVLSNWREAHKQVEVGLLGPGFCLQFSGIIEGTSKQEVVVASNNNFVRFSTGKEADADYTTFEQAEKTARIEMERNNLEAVLELRPSDEISCSISVKVPTLHPSQSTLLN